MCLMCALRRRQGGKYPRAGERPGGISEGMSEENAQGKTSYTLLVSPRRSVCYKKIYIFAERNYNASGKWYHKMVPIILLNSNRLTSSFTDTLIRKLLVKYTVGHKKSPTYFCL